MKITQGKPTTQKAKKHKNKNVSKTVPTGTILQTRDEYFQGSGNYRKPGYQNKGLYRKAVVIDSNRFDELAVVKGTTKGIDLKVKEFATYKPFIETKDNKGKPIKINKKFKQTNILLPNNKVQEIMTNCLNNRKTKYQNKQKLKALKSK